MTPAVISSGDSATADIAAAGPAHADTSCSGIVPADIAHAGIAAAESCPPHRPSPLVRTEEAMLAATLTMTYLGPAKVLAAAGNRARLEVLDEPIWAVLALASPYRPAAGDLVLAIAQAGAWYVIGVIEGQGKTMLSVPGDLEISAPRGRIEISAARGVRLKSAEVSLVADRLEVAARSVFERFGEATRWVKAAFQLRAGRMRTCVEQDYDLMADRIVQRAEHDVRIDGSKIHLG